MDKREKDRLAVKTAVANIDKKKADNPFTLTGKGGSGSVPLTMTLSLTDNALTDRVVAPRQVQLVLNYLHELGGTATLKQLNDFSETSEANFWGRGDEIYNQTVSKITGHYLSRLTGATEWERKNLKGKAEIIKIVR